MRETAVFVGAVVRQNDRILLVRQAAGHSLEGQWTVPWGRIEHGESPSAAAIREIWEEGGVRVEVEGLLGVQELPSPQEGGIALVYLCRHVTGDPEPRDTETDAAGYYSLLELDAMRDPIEPWSDWLVRRVLAGRFTVTYADPANPLQFHGGYL